MCIATNIPLDFALKQNPYMISRIIYRLNKLHEAPKKEKVKAQEISKFIE